MISEDHINNFKDEIVIFIKDFIQKYNSKQAHTNTPLFCLDCEQHLFEDILVRLFDSRVSIEDGYIGPQFNPKKLFMKPIRNKDKKSFGARIFRSCESTHKIINKYKCDDLFVIADKIDEKINAQDINIEQVGVSSFDELKYLMGLSHAY